MLRSTRQKENDMSLPGWKKETVKVVAEYTGPVAELLVDDALEKCGVPEQQMTAASFLKFLQVLLLELPPEVDRDSVSEATRRQVLQKYGL